MPVTPHPLALLEQAAAAFIGGGHLDTGAPAGCNGPHGDPETPLRNTAHWTILFCRLHELTGVPRYRAAAGRLADRLAADEAIAAGRVPVLRTTPTKDKANGIIGAAWLIEALAQAGTSLQRPALWTLAAGLAGFFPFDPVRRLWCTREPTGAVLGIDHTLNHQVWFAMAAAQLPQPPPQLDEAVAAFVSTLGVHLGAGRLLPHPVASDGLDHRRLAHLGGPLFDMPLLGAAIDRLRDPKLRAHARLSRMYREKQVGYLVFTLHGLARLDLAGRSLATLRPRLARAYGLLRSRRFQAKFAASRWSYPYNPPGFEFPLVARAFGAMGDLERIGATFYRHQIESSFDSATGTMARGTTDAATLTARLYSLSLASPDELDRLAQRPSM